MKPIPKSLHTVTVLVRVAGLLRRSAPWANDGNLIELAAIELGYVDTPDTHQLKAKALKAMQVQS
jgi:hypothetical protein